MPPSHFLATLALLAFVGAPLVLSERGLLYWDDCGSFAGFAGLDSADLRCAVAEIEPPAPAGLRNFTLAWALAEYGPDLRLGLQLEDASWAAVAFPQYASNGEAPQLAGATALVFSRSTPGAAASDGPDAGGLAVAQFRVPGDGWSGLQPSSALNFSVVASGEAPGGAFAVLQIPDFQGQIPSFGTHYPIRFMPALVALGARSAEGGSSDDGSSGSCSGGSGGTSGSGGAGGTGPWCSPPAAAGSLVIPYSGGDVEDLVWWDVPPPSAGPRRRLTALAWPAALAAGLALRAL